MCTEFNSVEKDHDTCSSFWTGSVNVPAQGPAQFNSPAQGPAQFTTPAHGPAQFSTLARLSTPSPGPQSLRPDMLCKIVLIEL